MGSEDNLSGGLHIFIKKEMKSRKYFVSHATFYVKPIEISSRTIRCNGRTE